MRKHMSLLCCHACIFITQCFIIIPRKYIILYNLEIHSDYSKVWIVFDVTNCVLYKDSAADLIPNTVWWWARKVHSRKEEFYKSKKRKKAEIKDQCLRLEISKHGKDSNNLNLESKEAVVNRSQKPSLSLWHAISTPSYDFLNYAQLNQQVSPLNLTFLMKNETLNF